MTNRERFFELAKNEKFEEAAALAKKILARKSSNHLKSVWKENLEACEKKDADFFATPDLFM